MERIAWCWLIPMLLLGCVNLWLRAARWGVLLAPTTPLPTTRLLIVSLVSGVAGLGLPARGGDAVKLVLATRLPGVKLVDVAAAEVLERLVDGAIFGAFIAGAAVFGGVAGWPLMLGICAVAIYVPLLAAVPFAAWYVSGSAGQSEQRPYHSVRRYLGVALGAAHRRGPQLLARAARLSLLAWAAEVVSYYCLLVAFGWLAPPMLPFAAVGVANFAFAVPGAPASVGTFHLPVSSLLVDSYGADPSMAAAYALALHVGILAPIPLLACFLAARARWDALPIRVR